MSTSLQIVYSLDDFDNLITYSRICNFIITRMENKPIDLLICDATDCCCLFPFIRIFYLLMPGKYKASNYEFEILFHSHYDITILITSTDFINLENLMSDEMPYDHLLINALGLVKIQKYYNGKINEKLNKKIQNGMNIELFQNGHIRNTNGSFIEIINFNKKIKIFQLHSWLICYEFENPTTLFQCKNLIK